MAAAVACDTEAAQSGLSAAGAEVALLSMVVADAGAGVIFAAIWAMNVPSPIMIAAKIIKLRMTLLLTPKDNSEISPHPRRGRDQTRLRRLPFSRKG